MAHKCSALNWVIHVPDKQCVCVCLCLCGHVSSVPDKNDLFFLITQASEENSDVSKNI